VTKLTAYEEEMFRCLQDRELLLREGFGVKQALTSNLKKKKRKLDLICRRFLSASEVQCSYQLSLYL